MTATQTEIDFNQRFDGSDYDKRFDLKRLGKQLKEIFDVMRDGQFRTLTEISQTTGCPESSVSAQLRNLRKERFGAFTINKQVKGDRSNGLFEYQLQSFKSN